MNHDLDEKTATFGLLACGTSGGWSVDLDESTDGTEWSLTLDGPNFYITFVPSDLGVVRAAFTYLRTHRSEPLALGYFGSGVVRLYWDDEITGRCFLIVGPQVCSTARVTLSATDTAAIADAFAQVLEDLPPETAVAR